MPARLHLAATDFHTGSRSSSHAAQSGGRTRFARQIAIPLHLPSLEDRQARLPDRRVQCPIPFRSAWRSGEERRLLIIAMGF